MMAVAWRYRLAGAVYLRSMRTANSIGPFVDASRATDPSDVETVWCVECRRWRRAIYVYGDAVVCAHCHRIAAVIGNEGVPR